MSEHFSLSSLLIYEHYALDPCRMRFHSQPPSLTSHFQNGFQGRPAMQPLNAE